MLAALIFRILLQSWQLLLCGLPTAYQSEVRLAADWYGVEVEDVRPGFTERTLDELATDRQHRTFWVFGLKDTIYTQFCSIDRDDCQNPRIFDRRGYIDWIHDRFDRGVGDVCWPREGRERLVVETLCSRWLERRAECTHPCADHEYGCCEKFVDPVVMCHAECWVSRPTRMDNKCYPLGGQHG